MGINSNFDNSFLQPSLPPPLPNSGGPQTENAREKKGAQQRDAAGNIVRDGKERVTSDGSQAYADNVEGEINQESEIHDQEQGDEGGGGQGGSGEHDGSGGSGSGGSSGGQSGQRDDEGVFSFQEALEQLVGKGKISEGRNVAHISAEGQAQVLSRDEIVQVDTGLQYKDKYNLAEAFNAKDLSALKPDFPSIPAAKDPNLAAVAKEMEGNPWLKNSFMTALTENLMAVVRIKMEQQVVTGNAVVKLLNVIGDLGRALGDLALEKAKLEAEMHRWQAVAAFMSFGITVAAGALSIAGTLASTVGGGIKGNAASKNPTEASGAAGGRPIGGPSGAGGVNTGVGKGTTPSSTSTASSTTSSSSSTASGSASGRTGGGNVLMGNKRGVIGSPAQRGSRTQTPADANPQAAPAWKAGAAKGSPKSAQETTPTWQRGSAPQKSATTSSGETVKDGSISNTTSGEAKATTSAEGRTGWFGNKTGALKSKLGFKAKEGDGGGLGGPDAKADAKAVRRAENIEKGGEVATGLGQTLLQSSTQLGNAADNLVQMAFKPLIGEVERETQIRQTQKQIAQQVLESASNDFKEAGQTIDSALQALQKVQDETSRAHSLSRG